MAGIDLTQFGFTPTESLVYEVLLRNGQGTGYTLARVAGLARANAYSALEGLVSKGAATKVEDGRPRQYRAESPPTLIARISSTYGQALDRLSNQLESISQATSPTVLEVQSARAVLQLISQDLAKMGHVFTLLAPPDAFPLLAPTLRRPVSAGLQVSLWSTAPVNLGFHEVRVLPSEPMWPGMPIIEVADRRSALIASRNGKEVQGHWSSASWFVAAAGMTLERLGAVP
jgi:sugar-specific transcriptional regulator TrmB